MLYVPLSVAMHVGAPLEPRHWLLSASAKSCGSTLVLVVADGQYVLSASYAPMAIHADCTGTSHDSWYATPDAARQGAVPAAWVEGHGPYTLSVRSEEHDTGAGTHDTLCLVTNWSHGVPPCCGGNR
jgi:hypothetical protein